jgi:hypothetical protein
MNTLISDVVEGEKKRLNVKKWKYIVSNNIIW